MARSAPRHDRDAGGPADLLAAKTALRQEVWTAMRAAKVARFPGAAGRIPNFTGAEAAAERLRSLPAWLAAGTVKSNPDSAQWPVRPRRRSRPSRCWRLSANRRSAKRVRSGGRRASRPWRRAIRTHGW